MKKVLVLYRVKGYDVTGQVWACLVIALLLLFGQKASVRFVGS